jgi:hypothetical protein
MYRRSDSKFKKNLNFNQSSSRNESLSFKFDDFESLKMTDSSLKRLRLHDSSSKLEEYSLTDFLDLV